MGMFDFLYKSPNSSRSSGNGYYQQPGRRQQQYRRSQGPSHQNNHYHKQRTITHINKDSELPNFNYSYNNKNGTKINYNNNKTTTSTTDDYTRLFRLNSKIDNYICRFNDISEELKNIRQNLRTIYKEFKLEYDNDVNNIKKNKHIMEIGDRILAKLNSFNINDDDDDNVNDGGNVEQSIPKSKSPESISHEKRTNDNDELSKQQTKPKLLEINNNNNNNRNEKLSLNENQLSPVLSSTSSSSPKSPPATHVSVTMNNNNVMINQPIYTVAHAKYAIVNDDDDINDNDINGIVEDNYYKNKNVSNIYTSTPYHHQNNRNQSLINKNDDYKIKSESTTIINNNQDQHQQQQQQQQQSSSLYINMASRLQSEHPIIENCLRRIQLLRPRIKNHRFEHKLSTYKEINNEISWLLNELNQIDNDSIYLKDKNIAQCELHNLAGVLERSVECNDDDCIICNSFMYAPEISV